MKKFMILLLLCGCSTVPEYHRPAIATPAQWSQKKDTANPASTAQDWWKNFQSAELNALIASALAQNTDVLAGVQRIEQARAGVKITGANLLPSVDLSADASRARNNPVGGSAQTGSAVGVNANLSYELDLFGRNRVAVEGSKANLQAVQFDQEALKLIVMGDVANNYFTLLNQRERLAIADSNLANLREVLRIVEARYRAGSTSQLELSQQKSAVTNAEAARASLVEQIANTQGALAILEGKAPQDLIVAAQALEGLQVPVVQPSQPSSLLERRPDIRAAEADLVAANADIGAARAAYYPTINLGLGAGLSARGLMDPVGNAVSAAASLAAPIFSGGRLEGGVEQATARQKELVQVYRKTILVSFKEVEDALAAVAAAQERDTKLLSSLQDATVAYQTARSRYDHGAIDFQTLLDTQNALLSSQDSYAQARLARLTASVNLYRALGGGWQG